MGGIDETDDRHPAMGLPCQEMEEFPRIAAGTDQDDPVARDSPDPILLNVSGRPQGIFHELPPIRRSAAEWFSRHRRGESESAFGIRGTIHGIHVFSVLFSQGFPSVGPT